MYVYVNVYKREFTKEAKKDNAIEEENERGEEGKGREFMTVQAE